jgi:hypothetical protein
MLLALKPDRHGVLVEDGPHTGDIERRHTALG